MRDVGAAPPRGPLSAPSVRSSWRGVPVSGSIVSTPWRPRRLRRVAARAWRVCALGRAAATVVPARAALLRSPVRESKYGLAAVDAGRRLRVAAAAVPGTTSNAPTTNART